MPIFQEQEGKLKRLNAFLTDKEKKLQKLVEENLLEVLDMYFLETEYVTTVGGRIDTLAVDASGCPVIIEYKRNSNDNVINQALSYLKWLKAQKVEFFEMLMIKRLGKELAEKIKIDWKNPRVICIAESYNKFDTDTVEVIPIKIELYKYRFYENRIFSLDLLNGAEQKEVKVNNNVIVKNEVELRSEENGVVDVSYHLKNASDAIAHCFNEVRSKIFELDESISEKITTFYIAYRVTKNFAEVYVGRNQIKIHLRPADYNDPNNFVEKVPDSYNWSLNRRVYLKSVDNLAAVMSIIEQSYASIL